MELIYVVEAQGSEAVAAQPLPCHRRRYVCCWIKNGNNLAAQVEFETFNRQLNAVNRHTGSKLVNAVQQDVHAILQLGEAQIEKSARALIDAARNEADEKLSAELSRLEALRAVNPNIRDDELTAIESNRQQVMESPGSGRLASGCPAFDRCNASVTEPKNGDGKTTIHRRNHWLVILYQDDHIMVVNKPSGLLSVPGRLEEHKDSVMTRIQRDYPQAESVHRLDMATSGVIVVALTKAAERELKRQFREREPKKQYVARVWGASIPPQKVWWICR